MLAIRELMMKYAFGKRKKYRTRELILERSDNDKNTFQIYSEDKLIVSVISGKIHLNDTEFLAITNTGIALYEDATSLAKTSMLVWTDYAQMAKIILEEMPELIPFNKALISYIETRKPTYTKNIRAYKVS